jgi:IS605 OrfB family transposase
VSYTITRKPGRAGRYLTAAWATVPNTLVIEPTIPDVETLAQGPIVAADLNERHLAVRRLDKHGNPVGRPKRIDLDLSGSSTRRDAQIRHAITRLIRYAERQGVDNIAVEDLDFADARTVGRETMGRGARGKRFRRTVATIPTARFRNRLTAQAYRHGIRLYAVNPAYTCAWGDQHWRTPESQGAATERCDTHATRGSRRESYRPGHARRPAGEHQGPPPARDTGIQIPRTRPGKYAAPGPGNRYPGGADDGQRQQ